MGTPVHMATTAKISESAPRAHRDQAGQAGIATRCPSTIPPRMLTCMARPQCCTDAPEALKRIPPDIKYTYLHNIGFLSG